MREPGFRMYKTEPNTTSNRPKDLPFLVRNTATGKVNRYCADESDADSQALRLNRIFFPETVSTMTEETINQDEPKFSETMLLF